MLPIAISSASSPGASPALTSPGAVTLDESNGRLSADANTLSRAVTRAEPPVAEMESVVPALSKRLWSMFKRPRWRNAPSWRLRTSRTVAVEIAARDSPPSSSVPVTSRNAVSAEKRSACSALLRAPFLTDTLNTRFGAAPLEMLRPAGCEMLAPPSATTSSTVYASPLAPGTGLRLSPTPPPIWLPITWDWPRRRMCMTVPPPRNISAALLPSSGMSMKVSVAGLVDVNVPSPAPINVRRLVVSTGVVNVPGPMWMVSSSAALSIAVAITAQGAASVQAPPEPVALT